MVPSSLHKTHYTKSNHSIRDIIYMGNSFRDLKQCAYFREKRASCKQFVLPAKPIILFVNTFGSAHSFHDLCLKGDRKKQLPIREMPERLSCGISPYEKNHMNKMLLFTWARVSTVRAKAIIVSVLNGFALQITISINNFANFLNILK